MLQIQTFAITTQGNLVSLRLRFYCNKRISRSVEAAQLCLACSRRIGFHCKSRLFCFTRISFVLPLAQINIHNRSYWEDKWRHSYVIVFNFNAISLVSCLGKTPQFVNE